MTKDEGGEPKQILTQRKLVKTFNKVVHIEHAKNQFSKQILLAHRQEIYGIYIAGAG